MKNLLMLSLAFALFTSSQPIVLGQTIVHDVERDFSIASNPNGVWSYGWKSTLTGDFTLLPLARAYVDRGVMLDDWVYANNQLPQVFHNTSTNVSYETGEGSYPPGTVALNSGFTGWPQNYCVVRFTVPNQGNGRYRLESTVESRLSGNSSTDSDFHVVVNQVEVFGVFLPANSRSGYTNESVLNPGDTVDFVCGRGADGIEYGGGLKLKATLSTPPYCTPHKAKATAQLVNGFVVRATITDSGCGYTNAPLVLIQDGGGSGATARAVITDGRVTGIIITDAGIGYETPPRIVIASPPFVPTVSISVSKVKVVQNVVLGRNYVLEASHDAASWSQALPPFSATSESITNEFDTDLTGRYFRVRETP